MKKVIFFLLIVLGAALLGYALIQEWTGRTFSNGVVQGTAGYMLWQGIVATALGLAAAGLAFAGKGKAAVAAGLGGALVAFSLYLLPPSSEVDESSDPAVEAPASAETAPPAVETIDEPVEELAVEAVVEDSTDVASDSMLADLGDSAAAMPAAEESMELTAEDLAFIEAQKAETEKMDQLQKAPELPPIVPQKVLFAAVAGCVLIALGGLMAPKKA